MMRMTENYFNERNISLNKSSRVRGLTSEYTRRGFISIAIVILCIVWTIPDSKQIDADTEICLQHENKIIKCGETISVLHDVFEKAILSAYAAAEKQEKNQTEKYIQDALKHDVQLLTDYKNTLWDMKPSAKLVGNREEQKHVTGNAAMTTVTC
ncbi:hypothetical protein MAR_013396 [Mya arenaria]|uniref:Uncharacterized protein n=1 Tax=Mya arenaria TaxID=6604 RepID=A0ABY7G1B9_MYAAR|nr:hypothetical protein MAR_013396 [Mya arenaria]